MAVRRPARSPKPQGVITRGKTARNRLRRVDTFLASYDAPLLRRQDGAFRGALWVDLGYGGEPWTALETARRWARLAPRLQGLGIEIDPLRVAHAEPWRGAKLDFRLGGFNMPLRSGETVRLVRAFNVLRQYAPAAVADALQQIAHGVPVGGLLVEGTSDPPGRLWVASLWRRVQPADGADFPWHREALVFSTNFKSPLDPVLFQAVLPKDLIHGMAPGSKIHRFMESWKDALNATRAWSDWGARQWFAAAAGRLQESGYGIDLRRRRLRRGYLVWLDPELPTP